MVADKNTQQPYFFPFTLGGICSQITLFEANALKSVNQTWLDDVFLCVAREEDGPFLYELFRSYGNSACNYENLEIFSEGKLDLIIRNMTHCLDHRFFITFLLIHKRQPIGFFQVDPYRMYTIETIYQNKLLPIWNAFLKEPLDLHALAMQPKKNCKDWLIQQTNEELFNGFVRERNLSWNVLRWQEFVFYCIQTYKYLKEKLLKNGWIGNISYGVHPSFQHQGLMSKMILEVEKILVQYTECCHLFSDRIADKNEHSIALLKKLNFHQCGTFDCYYGENYNTRAHPKGNFAESCVCFYKKIV